MRRDLWGLPSVLLGLLCQCGGSPEERPAPDWAQWGQNPRHDGAAEGVGQPLDRKLAELEIDPFVALEVGEGGGALFVHYQVPLVDGEDVFMAFKTGRYVACSPPGSGVPFPCGPDAWDTQVWNQKRLSWESGRLAEKWGFASDWKPAPAPRLGREWEPVFHAAATGPHVLVPGFGGSVFRLDRETGNVVSRILPFGEGDPRVFLGGPLSLDGAGNLYYHVLKLDLRAGPRAPDPWAVDALGAWLVKVTPDDQVSVASFTDLIPGAPAAADLCADEFGPAQLPWPPSPGALPPLRPCGSQRPGLNVAPAIAADGTVYTVSRAHLNNRDSYLAAVGPDLRPKWAASLRGHLNDGCGSGLMPPTGAPGGCRQGARDGVDPATNDLPAGRVSDLSTASPVVAPDGSILYGATTRYNYSRGHLFRFSAAGAFLAAYDFGWDVTPAIQVHDGTWSVVVKDNRYAVGSYCGAPAICPPAAQGPHHITALSPDLVPEWKLAGPEGIEWCVNGPAVDRAGFVYANNEDGHLYAIGPDGSLRQRILLARAIGAAYSPVSIDRQGRVYTVNFGRLFALGR